MLAVLIVTGLCIFSVMVYLALSKKSRFWIRIAALIALGLMVLAMIVCVFVLFSGKTVHSVDFSASDPYIPVEPARPAGNSILILVFIIFLLALFVAVLILSLRENRSKGNIKTNSWD